MNNGEVSKINLGCGEFHKNGYVNVDFGSVSTPDVVHDLGEFPYPFDDSRFSLLESDHCLEHLPDAFAVMREIHRICKDGAEVIIRVPHFSRGFTHAQHRAGFDATFPFYFDPKFLGGYQGVAFESESVKLKWFAQPYLKKSVLPRWQYSCASGLGKVLDLFANLSPFACSRIWCFWVGGFEEIEFVLRVKK